LPIPAIAEDFDQALQPKAHRETSRLVVQLFEAIERLKK
jgi:hypothetical protein